ncbi:MAG: hypothetical protein R2761_28800 [Acidimicrobiales bacterium]
MSDVYRAIDSLSSGIHLTKQRLDEVTRSGPAEGTTVAEAFRDRDSIEARVFQLAGVSLSSSLDHLFAHLIIVEARKIPAFGCMSLLRAAHETALVARWLVDPSIGSVEQCERAVGAQYADYNERDKLERSLGITAAAGGGKTAIDRRADFMGKAKAMGMTKVDRKGDTVPKRPLPTVVDLFNLYESEVVAGKSLPGEVWYRLYSAFTHGKQWHILAASLARIDGSVAQIEANDQLLLVCTERVARSARLAAEEYVAHYGY